MKNPSYPDNNVYKLKTEDCFRMDWEEWGVLTSWRLTGSAWTASRHCVLGYAPHTNLATRCVICLSNLFVYNLLREAAI